MSSESFNVVEISSGLHEETLWVSVGFSSDLEDQDVLHFVCALEVDDQDRRLVTTQYILSVSIKRIAATPAPKRS